MKYTFAFFLGVIPGIFFQPAFSQSLFEKKKDNAININSVDGSAKVHLFKGKCKPTAKEELTYFWYTSNKIMQTKGGYDGKLLHGEYTSFYLSDNLKEKGWFCKGLKCGKWIQWYENGKIKETGHWKNGLRNGKTQSFNINGEKLMVAEYEDDQLDGTVMTFEGDKMTSCKKYDEGKELITGEKESCSDKGKCCDKTHAAWIKMKEKIKKIFAKKDTDTNQKKVE